MSAYKFPKRSKTEACIPLFRLHVRLSDTALLSLKVMFDGEDERGATKYRAYQSVNGKPMAVLCGAFSPRDSDDGKRAKYGVLTHAALKPGDTDADFFADYTEEHRDFVVSYGEELYMIAEMRYGYEGTGKPQSYTGG